MKFVGIIPARYASTRFPGKPLAMLGGKTVIQRVYEQVKDCFDDLYVATDDERIASCVNEFGGKYVMTSPDCKNGTERCLDAYKNLNLQCDVIVNIQGDEPFIQRKQVDALMACFDSAETDIATLVKPFEKADGLERLECPNSPKVIMNADGFAIYFSRSVIPYLRGVEKEQWLDNHVFYKHLGIYAYRTDVLKEITVLEQSPLEKVESLEQLRWLENGYKIKVGITDIETIGIDTPEDLERAKKFAASIGLSWND
ncbi:MAG: 3-deoxy-manno-octulosonate cytidylyltransferase [Bacteroidaceae bacterium]|nr:3-deoxy-manno-octulosonate cytidylyltransferase [Bacteroidales bacterium]MBQ3188030.1 3-deoxy-manno-octulosonate cytidylyltransferase [Bacteroidaceae bacterium]MBQ3623615.1 3-deoxy-manno-octulosonate cytidylyltransferase [Bacteroidaceae bacterium]